MNNLLVLTYWSFNDALIQTYTLPYLKIILKYLPKGSRIYVLCLEQKAYQGNLTKTNNQLKELEKLGIHFIRKDYVPFGGKAMLAWIPILMQLSGLILFKRISTIHCWCTPPSVFGLLLSKFFRKKFVIDSYEPHAEAMVENGSWAPGSKPFNILFGFEEKMTKAADVVIGTTKGMLDYAQTKFSWSIRNFFVKPACVNVEQFDYSMPKNKDLIQKLGLEDKIVMLYAGKFGGIYYDKEVFEFIKVAQEYFGKEQFKALILSNHSRDEIDTYCDLVGLNRDSIALEFVPHAEIQDYMNLADFAICPVRVIPTKKYCTPIKTGEYWAMGLPVLIPENISDDSSIIADRGIGYVWKEMSNEEFHKSCKALDGLINNPSVKEKIRQTALDFRDFEVAHSVYKKIYG